MTQLLDILTTLSVAAPFVAFAVLALAAWVNFRLSERTVATIVALTFGAIVVAVALAGVIATNAGISVHRVHTRTWFRVGHYGFVWHLVLDKLSVTFTIFSGILFGLIGVFSKKYLHREPGYRRFYLMLMLFGAGVQLVVMGGSLDMVFMGWELVGISSFLLIAFYHERLGPVRSGLRAFITYRVCDVGLLSAIVWLHHTTGATELATNISGLPWSGLVMPAGAAGTTAIGLLLIWASMGKSAQVPLTGWLPRAMEGPTPSSAIFYGAISIHLGAFLLLRAAPLLEQSLVAQITLLLIGVATAIHATLVGRAQTDIKSALAYASVTQVGIIFVEIALGLRFIPLIHIVAHAAFRSLQILRSPSLLHDYHHLEQAVGDVLPRTGAHLERLVPKRFQPWLYRCAIERGYLDALLVDHVIGNFRRALEWLDKQDQRWVALLGGQHSERPNRISQAPVDSARSGAE